MNKFILNKMEKIKSKYIIQLIFSFLKKHRFLSMINYNKFIQSQSDISLQDYKNASNYYIIKENNISKIYYKDSDILIFEGNYQKGKKIEGKEYKNDQVSFIGEYKNNLKYKGKEYNILEKLIFHGEYNKGLYWNGNFYLNINSVKTGQLIQGCGTIKQFNYEGFLSFKGIYKDGYKFTGIEFNKEGKKIYEGDYKYNLKWQGKFYLPNQNYIFEIKEGNGNIIEYDFDTNIIFEGELKNGLRYKGEGKEFYEYNGNLKFDGIYNNYNITEGSYYNIKGYKEFEGKFDNYGNKIEGILYKEKDMFNNSLFYGKFKNGKKYEGIEITEVSAFIGIFDNDEKYLQGKYYQGDYDVFLKKILFENGNLKELKKEEIEKEGNLRFIGEFKNGKFHKGKEYKYNQINFEGEYKNGLYFNGKSYKIKDKFNEKMEGFEGVYINGEKKGKEIIFDSDGNIFIEMEFKDSKNWNFIYLNDTYGEVINGNSDYAIEYKIDIYNEYNGEKEKIKKVYILYEGSYRNNERYCGKEYDRNNNIIFEGEFKNGKYYYGKEYYNNKGLKFEGEYKNGKYYKGKEYYDNDDVSMMYSILDKYYVEELRLKFEGIFKGGKKYIGWEYNFEGEFIFVGEYKLDLYWNGYFYKPGEFMSQKKSGFIQEGNGIDLDIYGPCGNSKFMNIVFEGNLKKGKINYLEFKIFREEKYEYQLIKDIDLNCPYEKNIMIFREINLYSDKKRINGNKRIRRFIENGLKYEITYNGEFKNGKYYTGKEEIELNYKMIAKRIFEKGIMVKEKNKKK